MIRIFHTADIHLDAPFSLSDPIEAEKRRTGLRSVFCSMIHTARSMKADVFLIAGDLFEESFVTKDTAEIVLREIAASPECVFFIIPGNHDPYSQSSPYTLLSWPENVRIFTDETPSFFDIPEKNLRVYGHAYHSKTLPGDLFSSFEVEDRSKINILLAHGFVGAPGNSCGVLMKSDIEKSGLDYIALGHVHEGTEVMLLGDTRYAYSGCAVGRSFDECGYKSAIVVDIEKNGEDTLFRSAAVKCCDRRFEILKVDLSGIGEKSEALSVIKELGAQYGDDTALRVVLDGAVSPELSLSREDIKSVIRAPFYLELCDNTLPIYDTESLKCDKTVLGAFYRKLESGLYSEDPTERKKASLALRCGISILCGRDLDLDR